MDDVTLPAELEEALDAALGRAGAANGFAVEHHRLDLVGRCADCQITTGGAAR